MNAGVLPANNMYDMPADIMLVLLAIQGDVDAAVVEAQKTAEKKGSMEGAGL